MVKVYLLPTFFDRISFWLCENIVHKNQMKKNTLIRYLLAYNYDCINVHMERITFSLQNKEERKIVETTIHKFVL